MSTFGEIAEPVSRTFWEDWDINTDENIYTKLEWNKEVAAVGKVETLLVLEGRYLFDSMKYGENSLEPINSIKGINICIYKFRDLNTYVCVIKDYDLLLSSEIVELLHSYIKVADEVITILLKPLIEFQTSESLTQNCLVRRVSTKVQSTPTNLNLSSRYSKLEQPNMISGVSAGVVSLREFLDMPASAIIFYTEHPEIEHISDLKELLAELNIVCTPKSTGVLNSNMYI